MRRVSKSILLLVKQYVPLTLLHEIVLSRLTLSAPVKQMRLHAPTPATNGRFYLQLGENCTIYTARLNLPLGLKGKTSADAEVRL